MTTTDPTTQAPPWLNLEALGVRPDAAAYVADLMKRLDEAFEAVLPILYEAQEFGNDVEMARLIVIRSARAWAPEDEGEDVDIVSGAGPMVDMFTGMSRLDEHLRHLSRLLHPDLVFAVCKHKAEQAFELSDAEEHGEL